MKKLLPKRLFLKFFALFLLLVGSLSVSAQVQVDPFTAAGTNSWTCPAGVTTVTVECWGGGGAGGGSTSTTRTGGGGGGGAYKIAAGTVVIPGTTYTFTVGSGGTGSTGSGTAGSNTVCLGVTANGGSAGTGAAGTTNGNGGAAATGTQSGGTGKNGSNSSSGGGGGGAGDSGGGGNGGNSAGGAAGTAGGGAGGNGGGTGTGGAVGTQPGGGGGGAGAKTSLDLKGGNGGIGRVEISYAICSAPTASPTVLNFTPGTNNISGSFTASSPAASGYLVIRTDNTATPTVAPVNGTAYITGNTFGNATVVSSVSTTTFNATGLAGNAQYSFWVYGYNNTNCAGGPEYRLTYLSGNTCTTKTTPTAAPTSPGFTPAANAISGSFTAASPVATGYLVIRTSNTATPTVAPVSGTAYAAGNTFGNATVVSYGTTTTFTASGLTTNAQYSFYIYSYNATNCSTTPLYYGTYLSGNSCTTTSAPTAPPTALSLTPAANAISGSFTASAASGYLVIRTDNTSTPTVAPVNGTAYTAGNTLGNATVVSYGGTNTFNATALTGNAQYSFWIYAYNTTNCSTAPVYFATALTGSACTTKTTPTAAPTSLGFTPAANAISGSFTAASPVATGYLVIRTSNTATPTVAPVSGTAYAAGNTFGNATVVSYGTTTTFTASGLTTNAQYSFYIYSYNATNCSTTPLYYGTYLSGNSCTTTSAPTAAPTALSLTPAVNAISGSFTTSAASGYLVIRTDNTATPTVAPVNGTAYTAGNTLGNATVVSYGGTNTFNATALTGNAQYSFWIYAYNITNCSTAPEYFATYLSGNACTTKTTPTAAPTSLGFTPAANAISGSFTAASPVATGYLVIRTSNTATPTVAPVSGTAYAAGNTFGNATVVSYGTTTTFTASGLTTNAQYSFYIYSYNATNCSTTPLYYGTYLSGNSCTTTSAPTAPPTALSLTPAANAISGSFTASAASGYLVIRTDNTSTPTVAPVNGTAYTTGNTFGNGTVVSAGTGTTFNAIGLTANAQYSFWIYSYNTTACSAAPEYFMTPLSGTSCVTTTAPTNAPTALSFTPGANDISGSYTASTPLSTGYLVIRTDNTAAPTVSPTNGTTYTAGNTFGNATVVSFGATTTFNAAGLAAMSQYTFWVYGYNTTTCSAAPAYATVIQSGTSCTIVTTPSAQPTGLILTSGASIINGTFTAASASGYLVVRTATSAAPSAPVNGTAYTPGTIALGGFIESMSAVTSFTSSSLAANTQYWYWIVSYNTTACGGGPIYLTTAPLTGNTFTCTPPSTQATGLILTPYANVVNIAFTAASPVPSGYLVVRTNTAAAPSSPVDGTTYTAGSTALGGTVESAGTSLNINSLGLTPLTQYWFWVFTYNATTCTTPMYNAALPLTGTATTVACGTHTNTATITTPGSATYNWSALSWSLGHLPTACEHSLLVLNNAGAAADQVNVRLDVNISVQNFDMQNISPGPYVHIFNTNGSSIVNIAGNMTMVSPGGNRWNRTVFGNQTSTTINGNLTLGRIPAGATDGHAAIGSTSSTPGQLYTIYGNMTFNPRGYTTDEWAKFVFDKAGTQYIYNYTLATDTVQPVLFEHIVIGNLNATTVIFGGTAYDAYIENVGRQGVQIGVNSTLDLPANYSLNLLPGGTKGYFKMLAGSRLRLGGDNSIPGSGGASTAGSNYPARHLYNFDPASTIEYYGSNAITQTVYAGQTYQNLELTNGTGSGRAAKTNTGNVTVAASLKIKTGADWNMGSTITANAPFDVQSNGGLYCGTNIVYGTGAFTLNAGGYLGMGDPAGITAGAFATGNVQASGTRTFSTGGNYIYNGSVPQITGSGLPGTCNDLTINNPTTVTITTNQIVTGINKLQQGMFDVGTTRIGITGAGTLTSVSGVMKANRAVVDMNGSSGTAQLLSGSWFVGRNISTLINSNTTGITLSSTAGDTLLIGSALLYGPGTTNSLITTNNNLTLLSRDTATARFGEIVTGSGNNITGNVNVERYISTFRKWRHLAWPTISTQTAMQSWMENNTTPNANSTSGYGTIVTDEKATWSANNFDSRSVSGPSVKYYDPVTNTYTGIPNTTTYQMNSQSAYYNFVRGDRACIPANSLISPTILRSTGTLKTGNRVFTIPATKFGAVGNPYASAIDLRGLDTLNLTSTFYVWDPKLTGGYGLGAYQTVYKSGANYLVLPGGGSYGALSSVLDTLESGQAMFVRARASAGTLTFKESAKTSGARVMARIGSIEEEAFSLLSLKDPGVTTLVDGCRAAFDPTYNNDVDFDDALKMPNTSENVSYKRSNQLLAIEQRHNVVTDDTLFINVTGYRLHQYQWDIILNNMYVPDRKAYFIDRYLNTSTALDLESTTPIVFDIINVPGSWAADRFMIVFKQPAAVLVPVHFTSISAVRNADKTVTVKWNTENEMNMQDYKIEYGADGNNFTAIGSQGPLVNNGGNASYTYADGHATAGNNFYRIRGNSINGQVQYTAIAKVGPITETPDMSIFPNPVTGNTLNVRFANQLPGTYVLRVTNKVGQVMHTETVTVQNNNTMCMIRLDKPAAPGGYQVTITDSTGTLTTIPFMIK